MVESGAAERGIPIVHKIGGTLAAGKRIAELLCGPRGGWVCGNRDVHDAPAFMRENDEHEQQPVCGGRDDEEVGGPLPGRCGFRGTSARYATLAVGDEPCTSHRGLTHGDAEFPELAVDARCTPEGIGVGHGADLKVRTSAGMFGRPVRRRLFPVQKQARPAPVPADNRLGLHEDERRPPVDPDAREPHPEQAVGCGQTDARSPSAFQDL
jgi:hypothetical protein